MEATTTNERTDRKITGDESITKACKTIRNWLTSNPPTPTTPTYRPKEEAENLVFSPSSDRKSLAQVVTNEGISPLTAENIASHSAQLADKAHTLNSQSLPQTSISDANRNKSSWSVSDDEPSNTKGAETKSEEVVCQGLGPHFVVAQWLSNIREPPKENFLVYTSNLATSYQYDIDTWTGKRVDETHYPETLQDHHLGPCRDYRDIAWRQANMTSELQIIRELKSRENLAAKLRSQLQSKLAPATPTSVVEEEATPWPNAECKVRPVLPIDFGEIAEIINLESREVGCTQAFESKKVTTSDVEKIYQTCRENRRPFIVAMEKEDELYDRSKWPKNAEKAYQEWLQFKRSQTKTAAAIFGFAFVSDARLGLFDTPCPGSRFTGQIKLFVHPNHRRKRYGSALLDRILLSVAPYHRSLVDYVWECPNPRLIYETLAGYNHRQYAWIYAEMFSTNKDEEDSKWKRDFLEKFGFKQMGYLPQAVKTDRCYESKWLDLAIWAAEAQPLSNIADREPGAWMHLERQHPPSMPIQASRDGSSMDE